MRPDNVRLSRVKTPDKRRNTVKHCLRSFHRIQSKGIDMAEIDGGDRSIRTQFFNFFTSTYGIFTIIGIVIFIIIVIGLSRSSFLISLNNNDTARGLITFLVVFTTVSIALILALYAIVSNVSDQDLKDRFGFAKEILTALIGILGTILGFYFASSTQGVTREATRTDLGIPQFLQVASAFVSNDNPKKGDTVGITSFVSGGKPPYIYLISFDPPNIISPIADKSSPDGVIKEEVKIPESIQKDTEFTFKIVIKDSSGKSAIYDEKTKKFLVKTP